MNADGTPGAELRYTSFGETRASQGELPTAYRYTGQLEEPLSGLYYYNARWYDPAMPLFIQPDTLVPNLNNPLDWNRYAYVRYNPVNFTDPTGHVTSCDRDDWGCQTHWDKPVTTNQDKYTAQLTEPQARVVDTLLDASEFVVGALYDPFDVIMTLGYIAEGHTSIFMFLALAPGYSAGLGRHLDEAIDGTKLIGKLVKTDTGFDSFRAVKKFLGSPGVGNHWHHIVEQCQIQKSGFPARLIQNTENLIAVDMKTHKKISAHYASIFKYTDGLRVRDWLAKQDFEIQQEYGRKILTEFKVIK